MVEVDEGSRSVVVETEVSGGDAEITSDGGLVDVWGGPEGSTVPTPPRALGLHIAFGSTLNQHDAQVWMLAQ